MPAPNWRCVATARTSVVPWCKIYKNLARHMPDNGMQMVMFTHQRPGGLG